ncbi:ABC transporter ATP-binding protein [Lactobacillus sp. UMNPBX1]|uniref:ABC transporter ATP-binding protein/permease n=1 Tax=Candidatus Lactobacillus pullistercoris TaxID=2838636 RepID=A0A9E2KRM7_9LACO|nr:MULTISPECIES: ABC transporter ATP-binding protein [Lactobacillus]MBU3828247.1 ABC transporter ATP-binding protein/permease [Candidatus Lactobacillus pullistercoris]MBI1696602.1 multidrug ABC transporter ATP-binding protein [Lactobacillus crispatus]OXC13868.1 multidrug ABC transporter ATP-binding protein [Lactobacillus crispatus]OXC35183.1 multidrug ABC transporter ATP-binding protein [Lactobacillus crispatus]PEH11926.1 ABC transporter ATP-binding protein [Lactobacillus sp. UMNPBX1]
MDEKSNQSIWAKNIPMKEQWQIIKRLFSFFMYYKVQIIVAIIGAFLVSAINMLLPYGLQYFLDHFLLNQSATTQIILFAGLLYALVSIIKAILQFVYEYYYAVGAEYTLEKVRKVLYRKLHRLGMRYFDQTPAGSIVSRVTNDTMTLSSFLTVVNSTLMAIFSIITALIAMFMTNKIAGLLMLVFLPIMLLIMYVYSLQSSKLYRDFRERLSRINTNLNESIEGVSVIQQFKQEERMTNLFEGENGGLQNVRLNMIQMNSLLLSPLTSLLYSLALAVSLMYFGFPLHDVFVPAGVVYAFSQYISQLFNPIATMMDQMTLFQDGIVAGKRIFRILDNTEYEPKQNAVQGLKIKEGKIEFKHVNFSYDGKHEILHDISFTVNPGETLGIVGHTGSGKSSIINVMMRFYEFYQGKILIDGVDIRKYPKEELRKKLGLVLQEPFMFYGDISSNIRLYNHKITDQQIKTAAKEVQADQFIEKMPGQYHAKVIEGGTELSQGERQLISFARTLVTDPKILVLDEATANVDTETETLIQQGLKRLRKGRTTLAIAHRLSTIADADQIIVLDKGRIIEKGTHEQLLAQKGYYYNLYTLQNDGGES